MPVQLSEIRLPLDAPREELRRVATKKAGVPADEVAGLEVLRRSLDRRHRRAVFCYSVQLRMVGEPSGVEEERAGFDADLPHGETPLQHRPLVVGSGPAGLFAAWLLARSGYAPILIERGAKMNHRAGAIAALNREGVLDPESNYLYGEGGAGTFSDGKLTTRSKDPRAKFVLRVFRDRTGVDEVIWDYRPHLGSDRIRRVVGRMRGEILKAGGEIRYHCRLTGVKSVGGRLTEAVTTEGDLPVDRLVLAAGHSPRELYRALARDGVAMERKPFQLGLRVEHPQPWVDQRVYGSYAGHAELGPADYRLAVKRDGRTAYSFCMCPGGEIIPAISDLGHMNSNGMSWSGKDTGFANSGLVTTLEPEAFGAGEDPLAGLVLQEQLEARAAALAGHGTKVPGMNLLRWLGERGPAGLPATSCRAGLVEVDLREVLPPSVDGLLREAVHGMERQMRGFLQPDALLVGPECRSSSPVRILRGTEDLESPSVAGLMPVGEGAGYAGGIVSAAIDGIRAAERIIRSSAPCS